MKILQQAGNIEQMTNGSIVSPIGFEAGGVHAGLRYSKKDIGMIFTKLPASCAAVYTQSEVRAAPLEVTQNSINAEGKLHGIIVNSACANACTGKQGLLDAYETREMMGDKFNLPSRYFAVASTGVIGEYLEMDKMKKGISMIETTSNAGAAKDFEEAILTTDTVTKSCSYRAVIDGKTITMGGAAKGSGMIHPNMATMLGFITTDANVESAELKAALCQAADATFNQITVDGDTSTNDMVLILANGAAGNRPLTSLHPEWDVFLGLLKAVAENLAKQIARDGEGATKLIEVNVSGMKTKQAAQQMAKVIVGSSLVKTAAYGADANWGRIIAAMGRSGHKFNPEAADILFGDILVFKDGEPYPFSEDAAKKYLEEDSITITAHLKEGHEAGTAWGCDLTYDYVKINASYRT
ncbi:bifunctional ornithine acetyltransferase/N-acetylglutamate synthase [Actinomycetes bacterium NPDC127524]